MLTAVFCLQNATALPGLDVIDHHSRLAVFWKCFGPTGDSPLQQRTRNGTRTHFRKVAQEPDAYDAEDDGEDDGKIKRTGVRWLPSVAKACLHIGFCKFPRRQNGAVQGVQVSPYGLSR